MPTNKSTSLSLAQALERARTQGPKVAASLVRQEPQIATIISKLVKSDDQPRRDARGNRVDNLPDINAYRTISEDTALAVSDAETIFDMLPDMKLCRQVLPSCILAPRDMVTMELSYDAPKDIAPPEVVQMLTNRLREHFERDYKITDYLQKIVEDALFNRGSYPVVVIPENSIDEMINRPLRPSMEAIEREFLNADKGIIPRGMIGPNDAGKLAQPASSRFSFEQFEPNKNLTAQQSDITLKGIFSIEKYDEETGKLIETKVNEEGFSDVGITVTDNADILKMPMLRERIRDNAVSAATPGAYNAEAYLQTEHKMSDREIEAMLYKPGNRHMEPMVRMKPDDQLKRRSVGEPIILHLPSESVIPVFVPGTPSKQIGFFVLLDEQGHPLNTTNDPNYYQEMSSRLKNGGSFASSMLQKVNAQMNGQDYTDRRHLAQTVRVFGEMIETDLMQRLKNGHYGAGFELASRDEIYRLMLARTLQKQHTNILFVPAEMMTYFAFQYNRDGVGKSLMEGMKVLLSIRVQLMFANVMASLRNSIGRTRMKIKFDETDPTPMKTVEMSITEFVRTRQNYFPLGMSSPVDIADWLQRASVEVSYEGHPGMPDTSYEFENYASQIPKPDPELDEALKKLTIMGTGLPPEQIDAGLQTEFATSVVQQSLLLTKRVIKDQETLEPLMTKHGRQVAKQYPRLVNDLRSILLDHVDKLTSAKSQAGKSESEKEADQGVKTAKEDTKDFKAALKKRVDDQNNGEDVKPDEGADAGSSFSFGDTGTDTGTDGGFGEPAAPDATGEAGTTGETESTGEAAEPAAEEPAEGDEKKEVPTAALKTLNAWGAIMPTDTKIDRNSQNAASDTTNTIPKGIRDKYTHEQLVTVEMTLNRFLATFEMHLPRPNSATMTNQSQSLQDYSELLEKGLEAYISEKWFTADMAGEEAKFVEGWKESTRAIFMRQFMADNGILPELGDIVATNDHGRAKMDLHTLMTDHIQALIQSLGQSQVKLKVVSAANDKVLDAAGIKPADGGGFGGGGGGFGGGGFGDTGGFGGGDAGFGAPGTDDLGMPPEPGATPGETPPGTPPEGDSMPVF